MKIAKNTVVAFDYTLKNPQGKILDSSAGNEPLEYLHGAGNIIPGLEKALVGLTAGDKKNVRVAPADAYGIVDPNLVIKINRANIDFPGNVEKGMRFHAQDPHGGLIAFTVTNVDGNSITLDGNHPLAGVELVFDIEIKSVRKATDAEIYARTPASHSHSCCCGSHHNTDDNDCCCGSHHHHHCSCSCDSDEEDGPTGADDCCCGHCR